MPKNYRPTLKFQGCFQAAQTTDGLMLPEPMIACPWQMAKRTCGWDAEANQHQYLIRTGCLTFARQFAAGGSDCVSSPLCLLRNIHAGGFTSPAGTRRLLHQPQLQNIDFWRPTEQVRQHILLIIESKTSGVPSLPRFVFLDRFFFFFWKMFLNNHCWNLNRSIINHSRV